MGFAKELEDEGSLKPGTTEKAAKFGGISEDDIVKKA